MSTQALHEIQGLVEKIESWATLVADDARAANNGLLPDAEDMMLLARTMRETARNVGPKLMQRVVKTDSDADRVREAMAQKLMEWFNLLSRIGCMTAEEAEEDDAMEDILRVASAIRRMAREVQARDAEVLWDESKASLQAELERLGLTPLISDEECDGGAPGDLGQWSHIIRLSHEDLNHLRSRLSLLDKENA